MKRFIRADREHCLLMPYILYDWLPEDTLKIKSKSIGKEEAKKLLN